MDLGRSGLLSWVSSIRLGSLGFGEENSPSDLPKSVFGVEDPSSIVTDIGLASFQGGLGGLGGLVDFRFPVDSPTHCTISANFYFYLQYFHLKVFNFSKISDFQIDTKFVINFFFGTLSLELCIFCIVVGYKEMSL